MTTSYPDLAWHRLSPVSILYNFLKGARELAVNLPQMAPLLVLILASDNKVLMGSAIGGGLLLLLAIGSVLQFWFFRYQVLDDRVLINDGVIKRNKRVIRFDRVQNINIQLPFYFKPFQLVSLVLETAGSKGEEGSLAGIASEYGQTLKDRILKFQKSSQDISELDNESMEVKEQPQLVRATLSEVALYGLTNNNIYWIFAIISPYLGSIDKIIEKKLQEVVWAKDMADEFIATYGEVSLVILVLVTLLIVAYLFSIIGAIFRFYEFELTTEGNSYKSHAGLVNKHEETLSSHKIQAIVLQQNFIAKALKRFNLVFQQVSSCTNEHQAARKQFLVPTRTTETSLQLLKRVLGIELHQDQFTPISRRFMPKLWLMVFFVPLSVLATIFYHVKPGAEIIAAGLAILSVPLVVVRWYRHGYYLQKDFAIVRKGFIGVNYWAFPLHKVQRVEVQQSKWQKKSSVANLVVYLASGRVKVPYMTEADAYSWFNQITRVLDKNQRRWF